MLPFKILTQEKFEAVTLPQAKSQCRVTSTNSLDDDHISGLICSASRTAQEYLHWMVSPGTVKLYSECAGYLTLWGGYIKNITTVTATDLAGEIVTLTTDDYSYNDVTEEIYIPVGYYVDIYVTYEAGATEDELPDNVRHGILMIISTMYNNREDYITGLTVAKMPATSTDSLSLSRKYVS